MNLAFPFGFAPSGKTRTVGRAEYVRGLIEQVVLCQPGERLNRPEFGCDLRSLIFEGDSSVLAAACRSLVHSSLSRWLQGVVLVESVDIVFTPERVEVAVDFTDALTGVRDSTQIPFRR